MIFGDQFCTNIAHAFQFRLQWNTAFPSTWNSLFPLPLLPVSAGWNNLFLITEIFPSPVNVCSPPIGPWDLSQQCRQWVSVHFRGRGAWTSTNCACTKAILCYLKQSCRLPFLWEKLVILQWGLLLATNFPNMTSVLTGFQELSNTTKCADNAEKIFFYSWTFTKGTPGEKLNKTPLVAKLQFVFWWSWIPFLLSVCPLNAPSQSSNNSTYIMLLKHFMTSF